MSSDDIAELGLMFPAFILILVALVVTYALIPLYM